MKSESGFSLAIYSQPFPISKLDFLKLLVIWRNYRFRNCQENYQKIIAIEKNDFLLTPIKSFNTVSVKSVNRLHVSWWGGNDDAAFKIGRPTHRTGQTKLRIHRKTSDTRAYYFSQFSVETLLTNLWAGHRRCEGWSYPRITLLCLLELLHVRSHSPNKSWSISELEDGEARWNQDSA